MDAASAWASAASALPSLSMTASPPRCSWKRAGSSRCLPPSTCWRPCNGSALSQQFAQFGDDLEQVAHQSVIRHFKNRRLGVLVDGDDGAGVLDAGQMLNRPGDADGDIQLRRNDLPGLAHLQLVG